MNQEYLASKKIIKKEGGPQCVGSLNEEDVGVATRHVVGVNSCAARPAFSWAFWYSLLMSFVISDSTTPDVT